MLKIKESVEKNVDRILSIEILIVAFLLKNEIPDWASWFLLIEGILSLAVFRNDD